MLALALGGLYQGYRQAVNPLSLIRELIPQPPVDC